jgi:hypothetical protein
LFTQPADLAYKLPIRHPQVSADSSSVSALAPPASRIPAVGVQGLMILILILVVLGIGMAGIRRYF